MSKQSHSTNSQSLREHHWLTRSSKATHSHPNYAHTPPQLAGTHRDPHEAARPIHDQPLCGYTIAHSATEEYDSKTDLHTGLTHHSPTPHTSQQTSPASTLSIPAIYAPHNQLEQPCRDRFWQTLTAQISSHRERTPLLVVGDFNALALDETAALPHAVGPHFVPGKTAEDDEPDDTEEGGTNQRQFHDVLSSQDYCLPQSWMEKPPRHRHMHKKPNNVTRIWSSSTTRSSTKAGETLSTTSTPYREQASTATITWSKSSFCLGPRRPNAPHPNPSTTELPQTHKSRHTTNTSNPTWTTHSLHHSSRFTHSLTSSGSSCRKPPPRPSPTTDPPPPPSQNTRGSHRPRGNLCSNAPQPEAHSDTTWKHSCTTTSANKHAKTRHNG